MLNSKNIIGLLLGIGVTFLLIAIPVAFFIGMRVSDWNEVPTATDTVPIPTIDNSPTATIQPIPGSISGRVWHDLCAFTGQAVLPNSSATGCVFSGTINSYQADGILESEEPGIGGVSISLGSGSCPSLGLGSAISDSDGKFTFTGLPPGNYCITVDPSMGVNSSILIPGVWTKPVQNASGSAAGYTITLIEGPNVDGVYFGWDYLNLPVPPATSTNTPQPTATPTQTAAASTMCNWAQFISDVTIADGAVIPSQVTFTKTWRLKNIGTCTWTKDFDLVFIGGEPMTTKTTVALPKKVAPNESVDISVTLTAPKKAGTYTGEWMLRSASGVYFGIGTKANNPIWVQINVLVPNPNYSLDLAAYMCMAEWRSATKTLPCPSSSASANGFVQLLTNPRLENRRENEPTIWAHPNNSGDGWITGTYPAYTVKTNDHFIAQVGCLYDSKGCNVLFRLQYRENGGPLMNIKKWAEVYDGNVTKIKLDLSELVGKKVQFVLTVEVRGGDPAKANAFWFVPRIQQIAPAPTATATFTEIPTATLTETPTATATETPTSTPE
jgi:hypothetical protein